MKEIIIKLTKEYKNKGYNIEIVNENEKIIKITIESKYDNKTYIEDLEILKSFSNEDVIKSNIDFLIHNSLERYLRGE